MPNDFKLMPLSLGWEFECESDLLTTRGDLTIQQFVAAIPHLLCGARQALLTLERHNFQVHVRALQFLVLNRPLLQ